MMMQFKSWLKKILPIWLKQLILRALHFPSLLVLPVVSRSTILTSVFYFLFSRKFDREHKAILSGRHAYQKSLTKIGQTSTLLRRNIHRLEKGLIMQPRRDVFAEGYVVETVKAYQLAMHSDLLCIEERKWFTDVLNEYFSIVQDTEVISKARTIFKEIDEVVPEEESFKKYIPYPFESLPITNVDFDELHKLFIKRRSVRWYQDGDVPIELIEKAINIATLAPSACNRQPYSFYVSSNKNKAKEMAACAGGTVGWVDNIPCTIAIIGDLSAYPFERDRHLIYVDASLASMQLMLALETLGLSSCTINWPDVESAENKMRNLLNIEYYQRPIMLLSVGYAENKGGIAYSQKKESRILTKLV
jgi:nitroreductase